jgi:hypothetical protein
MWCVIIKKYKYEYVIVFIFTMLIVSIFVFCIVLFLYLHIHFHLKRSNDLEVYEMDQPSKQRLEEVCDIRQPTTFQYFNEQFINQLSYQNIHNSYRAFDINIRDTKNREKGIENDFVVYIPVALKIAHEVLNNDTEMKYISENNSDFIDETGLIKTFQLNDEFLRPYMVSKCSYDILLAAVNTITPLRYDLNYRNYFTVTQGSIRIMLIPPKDARYLYLYKDYDIFEFRSPVNPWKVQAEYRDDFDKIKTLEVDLHQGMTMFIPAYWWYSIKFIESETCVCSFKYRTYMNTIAIIPELVMSTLQNINTKRDTIEKRVISKKQIQEKSLDTYNTPIVNKDITHVPPSSGAIEYTPSTEEQYLPKSLRGNNTNPYSIMNAMTETVQNTNVVLPISSNGPTVIHSSNVSTASTVNNTDNTNVDVDIVKASIPVSEYVSTQKEVTITSASLE